jgi:hypothetical protein
MDKKYLGLPKEKIIEIVLTSFVFGVMLLFLSHCLNLQLNERVVEFQKYQYNRERAEALFGDLSKLTNERFYKMKRLVQHYANPQYPSNTESFRNEYQDVIARWNSNLATHTTLLEARFDKSFRDYFKDNIHEPFLNFHADIKGIKEKRDQSILTKRQYVQKLDSLDHEFQRLSDTIDAFNKNMLLSIQRIQYKK